jgi:hydroxymethylpyrimidine pyrophosphatase-like HAD family hydrolase
LVYAWRWSRVAAFVETVAMRLLPLEAARAVLRVGRASGADALLSDDPHGAGVLIYDHLSEDNHALLKYIAWSRRIHGDREAEASVRHVASLEEYLDHEPVHIAFSGNYATMKRLDETLRRELGESVKVLSTLYPKQDFALVDVLHPEVSKGEGCAAVAAEYGFKREEVMAIGDNFNDLEMLDYAGIAVVMGNAETALQDSLRRTREFHLTATNDEDGVAHAIEKFILNDSRQ